MRQDWDSISTTRRCVTLVAHPGLQIIAVKLLEWWLIAGFFLFVFCFFLEEERVSSYVWSVCCFSYSNVCILAAGLAAGAAGRPLHTVWHVSCASEARPGSLWRTPSEVEEDRVESGWKSQHRCYTGLVNFQSKRPVLDSESRSVATTFNKTVEGEEIRSCSTLLLFCYACVFLFYRRFHRGLLLSLSTCTSRL